MTADEFRSIALSFPESVERSHMSHPDFRVGKKIFATLNGKETLGMTTLTPEQQEEFLSLDPAFRPVPGKWGEGGATYIELATADATVVKNALAVAWQNKASKS